MMASITTVRKASADDIPAIQHIAHRTWPATYGGILSIEQIAYMLDLFYKEDVLMQQMQEGHHFIIAVRGSEEIGFAGFTCTAPVAKLHKLYILPAEHGTGLGRILTEEVKLICRQKGCRELRLNVNRYNQARLFYEKIGFKVIAEDDIAIGNGYYMNDFIMQLIL